MYEFNNWCVQHQDRTEKTSWIWRLKEIHQLTFCLCHHIFVQALDINNRVRTLKTLNV